MTELGGDAPRSDELAAALGCELDDLSLLRRALVHRSWSHEHEDERSNERLEFLGDAVLGLAVAQALFERLDDRDEGHLSQLHAHLVSEPVLAALARDLGLGQHLLTGPSASDVRDSDAVLSDALEAVLGAVHLSAGAAAATAVVLRLYADRLDAAVAGEVVAAPKTALQEWFQARAGGGEGGQRLPRYETVAAGPDHAPTFEATVRDPDGVVVAVGHGTSKKRAEQAAAAAALHVLRDPTDGRTPVA